MPPILLPPGPGVGQGWRVWNGEACRPRADSTPPSLGSMCPEALTGPQGGTDGGRTGRGCRRGRRVPGKGTSTGQLSLGIPRLGETRPLASPGWDWAQAARSRGSPRRGVGAVGERQLSLLKSPQVWVKTH